MSAQLTPLLIIGGAFLYYSQQDSDTESSGSGESGDNLDDFMCIGISEASTCQDINDEDISQEEKRTKCLESDGQECAWVDRYMDDGGPNLRRLQCQTHIQDLVKETEEKGNRAVQKAMEEWKDDKTSIEACADVDQTTVEGIFALQAQKQICEDFIETDDYKSMTADQRNKNVCYEHFPEHDIACEEYVSNYAEWSGLTVEQRESHTCAAEFEEHCQRKWETGQLDDVEYKGTQPCAHLDQLKQRDTRIFFYTHHKDYEQMTEQQIKDGECEYDKEREVERIADPLGKYGPPFACYYKKEVVGEVPDFRNYVPNQKDCDECVAELSLSECEFTCGDFTPSFLTAADVKTNMYAKYDITKGFLEFEEDCPYSHYYDRAGTFGIRNHCYPPKM